MFLKILNKLNESIYGDFKNTKIINSQGKPLIVYHGSNNVISDFKYEFTNQGNDQLGSGFYFTSDIEDARGYGNKLHKVLLNIKKPLDADTKGSISLNQVIEFIKNAPDLEDSLSNWDDVEKLGIEVVIKKAAPNYVFKNKNIVRGLFNLANDFYPEDVELFNRVITKILKYDGIIKKHPTGVKHFVAFFPEQIKILKD